MEITTKECAEAIKVLEHDLRTRQSEEKLLKVLAVARGIMGALEAAQYKLHELEQNYAKKKADYDKKYHELDAQYINYSAGVQRSRNEAEAALVAYKNEYDSQKTEAKAKLDEHVKWCNAEITRVNGDRAEAEEHLEWLNDKVAKAEDRLKEIEGIAEKLVKK